MTPLPLIKGHVFSAGYSLEITSPRHGFTSRGRTDVTVIAQASFAERLMAVLRVIGRGVHDRLVPTGLMIRLGLSVVHGVSPFKI